MKFHKTEIADVVVVEPRVFGDHRGFFMETWRQDRFGEAGIDETFVQDNHSKSAHGVLRGLHYQVKNPQGKLIRVISGEVFDVAVDLRRSSPFFGKWVGEILSHANRKILWVPPGFAHGFYVMSEFAEFVYKCTDFYAPEHERCIRWDDSDLNIQWPLVDGLPPVLSDKDANGALLKDAECFE